MSLKDRLRVILMFSECENCDYMPKNAEKRRFIALMQKTNGIFKNTGKIKVFEIFFLNP